jgi:TonB family protein
MPPAQELAELLPPPELKPTFESRQPLLPDPKGPAPRQFKAPRQAERRDQRLELANAPELASDNLSQKAPFSETAQPKRPVRAFVAPAAKPVEQAKLTLPVAPDVRGSSASTLAIPTNIARPQPRRFETPQTRSNPAGPTQLALGSAPRLDPSNPAGNGVTLPGNGVAVPQRPQPKKFESPGRLYPNPPPGTAMILDANEKPPEVTGNDALTAAVISTTPSSIPTPVLPEGNLGGSIAAGPKLNPNGGTGERVETARVTMPGLTIREPGQAPPPPPKSLIPTAMVQVAPTSAENMRAVARAVVSSRPPEERAMDTDTALPGVKIAPTPPASYLRGRTVYSMSVQAPNVTSYAGSWMVWFAERGNAGPGLRPPGAIRKVDPVYVPSAMDDRVEGNVRLAGVLKPDGTVTQISVVSGIDDRLDQSAIVAFSKWLFDPAMRDGQPIELDIVVEIPFRLAPRQTK